MWLSWRMSLLSCIWTSVFCLIALLLIKRTSDIRHAETVQRLMKETRLPQPLFSKHSTSFSYSWSCKYKLVYRGMHEWGSCGAAIAVTSQQDGSGRSVQTVSSGGGFWPQSLICDLHYQLQETLIYTLCVCPDRVQMTWTDPSRGGKPADMIRMKLNFCIIVKGLNTFIQ